MSVIFDLSKGWEVRRKSKERDLDSWWNPRPTYRNDILRIPQGKERICSLYKAGHSLRTLSDWFLTSYETIRTVLKDADVLRRTRYSLNPQTQIGKEMISGGYIRVYMGIGFPGASKTGWIFKHRLILQKHLKRTLMPWEIVHHIDRNKLNNDTSNLKVLSRNDHPTCRSCPYYQYYVKQTGNKTFCLLDNNS